MLKVILQSETVTNVFGLASPKMHCAKHFFSLIFKPLCIFKENSVHMLLMHLHLTHHIPLWKSNLVTKEALEIICFEAIYYKNNRIDCSLVQSTLHTQVFCFSVMKRSESRIYLFFGPVSITQLT